MLLNLCVEGVGRVDVDRLRAAVDRASEACPGSRLVRRGHTWVDSGISPEVRLVGNGRSAAVTPELTRPLPGARKAYCEVLLLDTAQPTVVFRASHAVMDGTGLKLWATDVFRALRNETPLGARSTTTILDEDEPADAPPEPPAEEIKVPRAQRLLSWPGPKPTGGDGWQRWAIDGNHPALVAKLAAEIAKISPLPVTPIGVAVDARMFYPGIRSTANFAMKVILDVPAGQDWATTHAQLLTMLAERWRFDQAPKELLRAPRFLMRAFYWWTLRMDAFQCFVDLSSMGHVDLSAFSTGDFEATTVYEASPGGRNAADIYLVECGGHTEMTLAWPVGGDGTGKIIDCLREVLSPAANRRYSSLAPAGATAATETADRSVVEQFRDQVRATPEAIAVSGPDGDVSYAELERLAIAVAERLRAHGAGTDSVVGVLADRSAVAVAGVWGCLLAGAAYLPMDTKYPDARIRALLSDARSPACLVQRPHHKRDCLPDGVRQLVLDDLPRPDSVESTGLPHVAAPGDLAYVVYTSGSTGTPKGVEIEHRSLSNFASWAIREYGIDSSTRLPLLCSMAFDVAGFSLILPLLVGGTLLLMPDELNHVAMQEVLDNGANMLSLTPSHLDLITRLNLRPVGVRTMFVIGEQLTRTLAMRARETFGPQCRIINSYGPAEATIAVSHHIFDPERDTGAAVPIGVPQDNVTMYLLDAERRFVAPGETAELYIGGFQLARGYRGRPDLTRERFLYMADGSRVYRTGDLARRLPSGEVEFCGRIDDQIKIHGYRVEPAEIAQTLESHPGVASAVVVARSRAGRMDKNLCAYVITRSDVDIAELEAYLGERLPGYMVPAVTVKVDEIPRTVNGKVAVDALPDPFAGGGDGAGESRPRDEVEDAVAKIWGRILQVGDDHFGTVNDFHALGGDSLSLITMVAEVAREVVGLASEKAFIGHLPEIVRCPTVERVSELAKEALGRRDR